MFFLYEGIVLTCFPWQIFVEWDTSSWGSPLAHLFLHVSPMCFSFFQKYNYFFLVSIFHRPMLHFRWFFGFTPLHLMAPNGPNAGGAIDWLWTLRQQGGTHRPLRWSLPSGSCISVAAVGGIGRGSAPWEALGAFLGTYGKCGSKWCGYFFLSGWVVMYLYILPTYIVYGYDHMIFLYFRYIYVYTSTKYRIQLWPWITCKLGMWRKSNQHFVTNAWGGKIPQHQFLCL